MIIKEKKQELREHFKTSFLTKRQVAIELGGISVATIDRLRKENKLRSSKIRGQIMFSLEEMARYIVEEV